MKTIVHAIASGIVLLSLSAAEPALADDRVVQHQSDMSFDRPHNAVLRARDGRGGVRFQSLPPEAKNGGKLDCASDEDIFGIAKGGKNRKFKAPKGNIDLDKVFNDDTGKPQPEPYDPYGGKETHKSAYFSIECKLKNQGVIFKIRTRVGVTGVKG